MLADQTSNDAELLRQLRRGDHNAQHTLYKRYVDAMYHTAVRIVNNNDDAQDVVQECFIKVFDKIDTFREESTLGAWIKRIAINSACNHLRKKQRMLDTHNVELDENLVSDTEEVEVSLYTPENIHYAIRQLPSGSRSVLTLFALEGYSHKEISEILGITESTSKTQYRRGKALLKNLLLNQIIKNET